MCDYSLHAQATRSAEQAETLVVTQFRGTSTKGFASPEDCNTAVCLMPGTEVVFENNARRDGVFFHRKVGDRFAKFVQINTFDRQCHHDALEFANGAVVLITKLAPGQRAMVIQLPAPPMPKSHRLADVAEDALGELIHGL